MPAQQVPPSTCPYPRPTHHYSMARFPLLSDQGHPGMVIGEPSPLKLRPLAHEPLATRDLAVSATAQPVCLETRPSLP